jgi:phage shock protein C
MNTKLTRSTTDKYLGGVCGGIAKAFGLDVGTVRIAAVLLALFTQIGWVAYIVLWALLPTDTGRTGIDEAKDTFDNVTKNRDDLR